MQLDSEDADDRIRADRAKRLALVLSLAQFSCEMRTVSEGWLSGTGGSDRRQQQVKGGAGKLKGSTK